jgi:hypothetical protein
VTNALESRLGDIGFKNDFKKKVVKDWNKHWGTTKVLGIMQNFDYFSKVLETIFFKIEWLWTLGRTLNMLLKKRVSSNLFLDWFLFLFSIKKIFFWKNIVSRNARKESKNVLMTFLLATLQNQMTHCIMALPFGWHPWEW